MTDGNALIFHMGHLVTEDFVDKPHAPRDIHPSPVGNSDARALLSTVLQRVKTQIGHAGDIFRPRVDTVDAALFFPFPFRGVTVFTHGRS